MAEENKRRKEDGTEEERTKKRIRRDVNQKSEPDTHIKAKGQKTFPSGSRVLPSSPSPLSTHTHTTSTTTSTRARTLKASLCLRTPLVLLQRSAMSMAERDVATSARRRRERRLRSFLRHEELSVKMALARALHHSAQRVEEPREGGGGRDVRRATAREASTPGDAASQPG